MGDSGGSAGAAIAVGHPGCDLPFAGVTLTDGKRAAGVLSAPGAAAGAEVRFFYTTNRVKQLHIQASDHLQ